MISRREALWAIGGGVVGGGAGVLVSGLGGRRTELSPSRIYKKARKSVFTAKAGDSMGTAFCFGSLKDGRSLIMTAFHIYDEVPRKSLFENEAVARITTYDGDEYELEGPYSFSEATDAFGFTVEDSFPPLPLAENLPEVGEPIYVLGNPSGVEDVFTNGVVSGYESKKEHLQLLSTAPIAGGSSGSPVLNKFGEVVGMVRAMGNNAQNLNYALSSVTLNSIKDTLLALEMIKGSE